MTEQIPSRRRTAGAGLLAAAAALSVPRPQRPPNASQTTRRRHSPRFPTGPASGWDEARCSSNGGCGLHQRKSQCAEITLRTNPNGSVLYRDFLTNVVRQDKFVDPLSVGYPGGIMRMMSPARGLQFVLRPEQVWIIYERPDVRYIYTDGRPFPAEG